LARRFDARSAPTLLLIVGGEVVSRQVGALAAHALKSWVDAALAGAA
jgi:thioredoxin 2